MSCCLFSWLPSFQIFSTPSFEWDNWNQGKVKANIKAVPYTNSSSDLDKIKNIADSVLKNLYISKSPEWQKKSIALLNQLKNCADNRLKELQVIEVIEQTKQQIVDLDKIDAVSLSLLTEKTTTNLIRNRKELDAAKEYKQKFLKQKRECEQSSNLLQTWILNIETPLEEKDEKLVSDEDELSTHSGIVSEGESLTPLETSCITSQAESFVALDESMLSTGDIKIPESPWNGKQIKKLKKDIENSNTNISAISPKIYAEKILREQEMIEVAEKLQWQCRLNKLLKKENECLSALKDQLSAKIGAFSKSSSVNLYFNPEDLPKVGF